VPSLKVLFPNPLVFAVSFLSIGGLLGVVVGWLDWSRGTIPVENAMSARANPWVKDLTRYVLNPDDLEARKALERWL